MATISADAADCLTDRIESRVCPSMKDGTRRPAPPTILLLDSDIDKIVGLKLAPMKFRVLHWSLDSLGETNGFLGQYYRVSVTVKVDGESRRLKFFAKTPPPSSSPQYDFLVRFNTFNKEIFVYSEIVPRMGLGHGPKWLPDYYLGKDNTVIVLEDATAEGYVTPDKYLLFDEAHCVSVVRALSAFHSRSLILDEKLRRSTGQTILDLYGHVLGEVAFVAGDAAAEKYLSSCVKGACTVVDLIGEIKDEEASAIKDWITEWVVGLPVLLRPSSKYRNVMCHRDVWPNNIMFKRDAAGKPIGCYLIDFQFLRYSPPALDFVICLLLTTDRATRHRIYRHLVDIYYDTMSKELAAEGLDVDACLPKAQFLECCDELKATALAYSVANMQIMLLSKQAVEEYFIGDTDQLEHVVYGDKRCDLVKGQCRDRKDYQTRIAEIVEEIREHLKRDSTRL